MNRNGGRFGAGMPSLMTNTGGGIRSAFSWNTIGVILLVIILAVIAYFIYSNFIIERINVSVTRTLNNTP
jgi:hypothetical protein